ncbi:D-aminoacyl-tRNA deacylase [uncultured Nonlabens sp.]|uniref:D-aminoacyl-tRNA deacylase n=1 Tax=uncultured Nonlabens sp. TaxID=859306 RepID=UPI00262AC05E|nr:D-aminoacyl-tRNA deacylase [uncultured Nonlabens sp.]
MRVVIQRVTSASVTIEDKIHGEISNGLLVLLGITNGDTQEDIDWLINKITGMRIFSDAGGKMNYSVKDMDGDILLISQFTLFANVKKGNRPSYTEAARPDVAIPLYEAFIDSLSRKLNKNIATGKFGADMKVQLLNDGPVTITVDSKSR